MLVAERTRRAADLLSSLRSLAANSVHCGCVPEAAQHTRRKGMPDLIIVAGPDLINRFQTQGLGSVLPVSGGLSKDGSGSDGSGSDECRGMPPPILLIVSPNDESQLRGGWRNATADYLLEPCTEIELQTRAGNLLLLSQLQSVRESNRLSYEGAVQQARSRTWADLHDHLGAHLTDITLAAEQLASGQGPHAGNERKRRIAAVAKRAQRTLRELMPPADSHAPPRGVLRNHQNMALAFLANERPGRARTGLPDYATDSAPPVEGFSFRAELDDAFQSEEFIGLLQESGGIPCAGEESIDLIVARPDSDLLIGAREDDLLRQDGHKPSILVVGAAHERGPLIGALAMGATDYLVIPCNAHELNVRLLGVLAAGRLRSEKNHHQSRRHQAEANERDRIYRDLKAHLGGLLSGLAAAAEDLANATGSVDSTSLVGAARAATQALRDRGLAMEDEELLAKDFVGGLRMILLRRYVRAGRVLRFNAPESVRAALRLPDNDGKKAELFSIMQELCTNDLKYGRGESRWSLRLVFDELRVVLYSEKAEQQQTRTGGLRRPQEQRDQGESPGQSRSTAGQGLANIRRRTASLGGIVRHHANACRMVTRLTTPALRDNDAQKSTPVDLELVGKGEVRCFQGLLQPFAAQQHSSGQPLRWPSRLLRNRNCSPVRVEAIIEAIFEDSRVQAEIENFQHSLGGRESPRLYERYLGATYDSVTLFSEDYCASMLYSVLSLPRSGMVLDVGCGTGNFILAALNYRSQTKMVGLDFSPAVIGQASNLLQRAKLPEDRYQLICADFLQTRGCAKFDALLFHNFLVSLPNRTDVARALRIAHDHLKPGGTLTVVHPRPQAWSQQHLANAIAKVTVGAALNGSPMTEYDVALVAGLNHGL